MAGLCTGLRPNLFIFDEPTNVKCVEGFGKHTFVVRVQCLITQVMPGLRPYFLILDEPSMGCF